MVSMIVEQACRLLEPGMAADMFADKSHLIDFLQWSQNMDIKYVDNYQAFLALFQTYFKFRFQFVKSLISGRKQTPLTSPAFKLAAYVWHN